MTLRSLLNLLVCGCLLLASTGCGNKGPLVLEEDEEKKQEQRQTRDY